MTIGNALGVAGLVIIILALIGTVLGLVEVASLTIIILALIGTVLGLIDWRP